ncbi:hypothetical protein [Bradyrhizobium sp.]|uniref:hypothetical protein n=1 Tax=Bradyrhizobium sp. TaxID=376 RepID=UPI0040379FC5
MQELGSLGARLAGFVARHPQETSFAVLVLAIIASLPFGKYRGTGGEFDFGLSCGDGDGGGDGGGD